MTSDDFDSSLSSDNTTTIIVYTGCVNLWAVGLLLSAVMHSSNAPPFGLLVPSPRMIRLVRKSSSPGFWRRTALSSLAIIWWRRNHKASKRLLPSMGDQLIRQHSSHWFLQSRNFSTSFDPSTGSVGSTSSKNRWCFLPILVASCLPSSERRFNVRRRSKSLLMRNDFATCDVSPNFTRTPSACRLFVVDANPESHEVISVVKL